ncbi:hypothetical protein ACSAGD_13205 [Paramicrobacterium sp. CJ85]|uniref:hypothetical protein n=1 Tax=Paramicrobacterium sp. CJ85 TaxID=3445355 RepID=UPI003F63C9C3
MINEGKFLEIYWDRYVDENAVVDPDNITLLNGDTEITLTAKPETGSTNSIFFDKKNKQIAETDANSMERLPADLHLASIAYEGSIDADQPLTVMIDGSAITDEAGKAAKDAEYTGVPKLDYYTQFVTTETGITVKAADRVDPATLENAATQVDVELGKSDNGIAARMAEYGCSLAVYASLENAYLIPEHRGGYDPEMYDVEGYGGSTYNNCVSSISERNVLRTRDNANPDLNTGYPNENILIHEFGHAVRLVGIETLEDTSLSDEFYEVYKNAYNSGLWPNTYAISNSDEFFATLSAIWFDVMAEKPDWSDGVRSPINTRAELKEYDPKAYDFFAKVYPSDLTLPAPWDEPAPDEYHGDYTEPPAQTPRETATDVAFGSDTFRIAAEGIGNDFQIDRFAGDSENPDRDVCIWFTWGDGVWTVDYENGLYTIAASDGSGVLSAISDTEVRYAGIAADDADPAQKWKFVADAATEHTIYDGILVNASTGTALTIDGRFETGVSLTLAAPEEATPWMLEDTTRTAEQGTAAYVLPVEVTFTSEGQDPVTANVPQQAFTLPEVTDVAGADWSRDGYEFLGWRLADEQLDAGWTIPDGTTAVALDAAWDAVAPTDPEEPAPGDDTDTGASDGSGAGSATDNASADASGDLPRTGADAGGLLVAALIALALGTTALIARRRIGARNG